MLLVKVDCTGPFGKSRKLRYTAEFGQRETTSSLELGALIDLCLSGGNNSDISAIVRLKAIAV